MSSRSPLPRRRNVFAQRRSVPRGRRPHRWSLLSRLSPWRAAETGSYLADWFRGLLARGSSGRKPRPVDSDSRVLGGFEPLEDRRLLTSATAVVSAVELSGMQLLYAVNDNQFDFNDAYTVNNSGSIPAGSFTRVGYFVELGSNWVYGEMDTFNTNPTMLGVPKAGTNIVQNGTLVNNLNVESNHSGVTPGTGLNGIIEFWASNYGPDGGGLVRVQ